MRLHGLFGRCLVVASTLASLGELPAQAMNLRNRFTALAFSEDGRSVLVRAEIDGPEGGRVLSYEIWSADSPHRTHAELSSNLSTGGAKPEKIDAAACAQALRALGEGLKKRGFKGVAVHPDRCAKREGLVTAEARLATAVTKGRFQAKDNKLAREGVEVRFAGTQIAFYRDERKECSITQPKRQAPASLSVWGTPSNRLVYIVEETSSGDEGLLGMCALAPDGQLHALPTSVEK